MKILLTGGGSGGPVMPVLAVAEEIRKLKPKTEFLFVGTRKGPEKKMVEEAKIKFVSIPAAKWRRYFSLKNLISPFLFVAGFISAWMLIRKFRPQVIFSAGAFVGVPAVWAGKMFGAKIMIHQQDARIGLANKLVSPIADQITTAFEGTAKLFYSTTSGLWDQNIKPRAEWVGNPTRPELLTSNVDAKKYFNLHDELPILFAMGGATGSEQINALVVEALPQLVKSYQVIHQTGRGKNVVTFKDPNYHAFELIPFNEYAALLRAAHLVVARAGLSTIAELSVLGKVAVVIPMPKTHQEDNAKILSLTSSAVALFRQDATAATLVKVVNNLKFNPDATKVFSKNIKDLMPHDAAERIAKLILKYGDK